MTDKLISLLFDEFDIDENGETDVTISVDDKLFPAHRRVLKNSSLYFATLFQSGFKDKTNETITISGPIGEEIKSDTFQSILKFCYRKQSGLTENNVCDILAAAEFLQIDTLKDECIDYLKTILSTDNMRKIYRNTAFRWNYVSLIDD